MSPREEGDRAHGTQPRRVTYCQSGDTACEGGPQRKRRDAGRRSATTPGSRVWSRRGAGGILGGLRPGEESTPLKEATVTHTGTGAPERRGTRPPRHSLRDPRSLPEAPPQPACACRAGQERSQERDPDRGLQIVLESGGGLEEGQLGASWRAKEYGDAQNKASANEARPGDTAPAERAPRPGWSNSSSRIRFRDEAGGRRTGWPSGESEAWSVKCEQV